MFSTIIRWDFFRLFFAGETENCVIRRDWEKNLNLIEALIANFVIHFPLQLAPSIRSKSTQRRTQMLENLCASKRIIRWAKKYLPSMSIQGQSKQSFTCCASNQRWNWNFQSLLSQKIRWTARNGSIERWRQVFPDSRSEFIENTNRAQGEFGRARR